MADNDTFRDEIKKLANAHDALAAEVMKFGERYNEDFEKLSERHNVLALNLTELNKTLKNLDTRVNALSERFMSHAEKLRET
jgi:predicted  nucleic acid-binding Zn-ribbon protein